MPKPSQHISKHVPAVTASHCAIGYGEENVLEDISFDVPQGAIAAIVGPNGSGKTTLMKAMLGLLPVRQGSIEIFGKHFHSVRDLVGYVPQRFDFDRQFPLTVREFMELGRHAHCPVAKIAEKIKEVGLPLDILGKKIGALSGGQLQRTLMAQAILNDPAILFLDEPATGIDITGEEKFFSLIGHLNRAHKTTVIMVTHDIAMVSALVDTVICVNKKLLCFGPPKTALTAETLAEIFGSRATPFQHGGHDAHHH